MLKQTKLLLLVMLSLPALVGNEAFVFCIVMLRYEASALTIMNTDSSCVGMTSCGVELGFCINAEQSSYRLSY